MIYWTINQHWPGNSQHVVTYTSDGSFHWCISTPLDLNILKCHFADIFKWIFITEKMYFWVQFHRSTFLAVQLTLPCISLVQAMAWQQTGDKPEPLMARFLTLYGVTRHQWVNSSWPSQAKWQHRSGSTLAQVLLDGTKPLSEAVFANHQWGLLGFN